jgi:hypothetical protein
MAAQQPAHREGLAYRGKHWRVWMGLDGVARCILEGDHDEANMRGLLEAFADLGDKVPERPLRILLYAHRPLSLQPGARELMVQAFRAHLGVRLAVVRASPLARIQARAIARHSGREFTYHDNEPEALRALGQVEVLIPVEAPAPVAPKGPDLGIVDHVS